MSGPTTTWTLVAAKEKGPPHSPWMWRQITGMPSQHLELLYWMPQGATAPPAVEVPVHVLDVDPTPYDGKGRWVFRASNLIGRNFYAARGKERRELRRLMLSTAPSSLLCYYGEVALRTIDVAHELGIPTVAYFHGDFGFKWNRWYRWSLQRRLGWFEHVVVVTEEERLWMLGAGVAPERVHVIPCGAPTAQFLPKEARTTGPTRFVMVSRLAEEKGCHESIAAFAELASEHPDASLDIYGDGPSLVDLTRLVARHRLTDRVRFCGHVDSATLARVLPQYDVFLQHSLFREGSPVSIVEAMACALPVIATSVGGNVDLVVDGVTGFIVAERDTHGMARAMIELANDEALRDRMGSDARRRAVELFDTSALTSRLEQLVESTSRLPVSR